MIASANALLPTLVVVATVVDAAIVNVVFAGHPSYTLLTVFAGLFVVTYLALAGACRYAMRARSGPAKTSKS